MHRKIQSSHLNLNKRINRLFFQLANLFHTEIGKFDDYLALINRVGGLYGRILTDVASTDRTQ